MRSEKAPSCDWGAVRGTDPLQQLCPIFPTPSEDSVVAEQLSPDMTWLPGFSLATNNCELFYISKEVFF